MSSENKRRMTPEETMSYLARIKYLRENPPPKIVRIKPGYGNICRDCGYKNGVMRTLLLSDACRIFTERPKIYEVNGLERCNRFR